METTERIVEAYCRYIKHWFTIPNIRVKNNEIDLIAMDRKGNKAHIEVGVSISGGFSKLTAAEYTAGEEKQRTKQAKARTKLGYFETKKFGNSDILLELKNQYGFEEGAYKKIVVAWRAEAEVVTRARSRGIEIWLLPDLIREIENQFGKESGYYRDDTIRTLHLAAKINSSQRVGKDAIGGPDKPNSQDRAQRISIEAWKRFVSNMPRDKTEIAYTISEISQQLGNDLQRHKAAIELRQFWQGDHKWVRVWRQAVWSAKPVFDKSRRIIKVRFVKLK
jgi:hypothetical protein